MADRELSPIVKAGRNCWRIERAEKARMIVDAADYYALLEKLMARAKERIVLIGWDFDPRITLTPDANGQGEPLGDLLMRLAKDKPERDIDILRWNFGGLRQMFIPRILAYVLRWKIMRAISFQLDGHHPIGCSHHQKVAVFDDQLAVCGGIDVGAARWDTRAHLDDDPRRQMPDGKPYCPWHDSTMILVGPVGKALAELGNERWKRATRKSLKRINGDGENWPADLQPDFRNVDIAISRTRAAYDDCSEVHEIEQLYLDIIAAARQFAYIENQYFTSAKLAAAIAERLEEEEPPEFVLVMPKAADGWLEQMAMDGARVQLVRRIAKARNGERLQIYVPRTNAGEDIYVHSKIVIVDDRLLRIGSSNMNNRSMSLDSECDVSIDAGLPANASVGPSITRLREELMAEHLGVDRTDVAREFALSGSLIATINTLTGPQRSLERLDLISPGPLDTFIAENELLDPVRPEAVFENISQRGLRRTWDRGRDWIHRHRPRRRPA